MKNNLVQTIKNLDAVLGVKPVVATTERKVVKPKPAKAVEKPKIDYFKFAEVVNGRCAMFGTIIGHQYTHDDPVHNIMVMLGITMVMSSITMYTFDKRDESAVPENLEQVTGNFNMLSWFINLIIK